MTRLTTMSKFYSNNSVNKETKEKDIAMLQENMFKIVYSDILATQVRIFDPEFVTFYLNLSEDDKIAWKDEQLVLLEKSFQDKFESYDGHEEWKNDETIMDAENCVLLANKDHFRQDIARLDNGEINENTQLSFYEKTAAPSRFVTVASSHEAIQKEHLSLSFTVVEYDFNDKMRELLRMISSYHFWAGREESIREMNAPDILIELNADKLQEISDQITEFMSKAINKSRVRKMIDTMNFAANPKKKQANEFNKRLKTLLK